jgi:hypothetical protein
MYKFRVVPTGADDFSIVTRVVDGTHAGPQTIKNKMARSLSKNHQDFVDDGIFRVYV